MNNDNSTLLEIHQLYMLKLETINNTISDTFKNLEQYDEEQCKHIINNELYKFNQIDGTLELLKNQIYDLNKKIDFCNVDNVDNVDRILDSGYFNAITKKELDILFPIMYGLSLNKHKSPNQNQLQTPINDSCS
jgi:hypothetical protein